MDIDLLNIKSTPLGGKNEICSIELNSLLNMTVIWYRMENFSDMF